MEANQHNGTILIIDDTITIIDMVKTALENSNYHVLVATSGNKGIKSAQLAQPDLILLDILMPEIDGYDTCEQLKADIETADIPVIFMSALTDTFDKVKAFRIGAVDYITKPLNVEELLARVNTHVTFHQMQKKLMDTNTWLEEEVSKRTLEINKSKEKYQTVADFTVSWEYWVLPDGSVEYMSPSCKEITGYERDEFIKNPDLINSIVYVNDQQEYKDHVYIDSGKPQNHLEFRIKTKTDEIKWIDHLCRKVFDAKGNFMGIRASNRDITEIKNYEINLHEKNDELQAAEEELMASNDALRDTINKLERNEKQLTLNNEELEATQEELTATNDELKIKMQDLRNAEKEILNTNEALQQYNEKLVKQTLELERAKTKAEESDQLKSQFLANMSHEIRTPMNAIIGFSNIIKTKKLSDEKRNEFLGIIVNSGHQLLSIVNDVLDISRIETGQLKVVSKPTNLQKLTNTILSVTQFKAKENTNTLKLSSNPELTIASDENRLTQILSNLINNALKFTKNGIVEFGYNYDNTQITFFVKDSGVGISEESIDKIFKRFTQEENAQVENGGLGLGLSISKGLVEKLGGKIWVESKIDVGSTFYFTLPNNSTQATPDKSTNHKSPSLNITNKTLLIAEDNTANFLVLKEMLSDYELTILHASDGREAMDYYNSKTQIDLILMDIRMPIMDGIKATLQIKEQKPTLPIIAQTAYATNSEINDFMKAGFDDYITKPIDKSILISKLKKYILQ